MKGHEHLGLQDLAESDSALLKRVFVVLVDTDMDYRERVIVARKLIYTHGLAKGRRGALCGDWAEATQKGGNT